MLKYKCNYFGHAVKLSGKLMHSLRARAETLKIWTDLGLRAPTAF